jgi:AcrR family transcriptional regulator
MDKTNRKVGRRPGKNATKAKIVMTAGALFAKEGYDQVTIRGVAKHADVDPALVMHYFGSKQELFIAAMTPAQQIPHKIAQELSRGDPETLGFRLATFFICTLESKATGHIVINALKGAIRIPGATILLKTILIRPILKVFRESTLDNPELRATLAQSQLVGLVMTRYILKVEPLASLPADELIAYLAPTLQRYLADDLHNNKGEVL